MFSISLFGAPSIHSNGQPLAIQRRTARALLFYLAAQPGPTQRSALLNLFWPDTEETKARAALRDYLHKLRRDLGEETLLQTEGETLGLDPAQVQVDYLEFQRLTANLPRSENQASLSPETYQRMSAAIALCQPPNLLGGDDLDLSAPLSDWRSAISLAWENQFFSLLERLSSHEIQNQCPDKALEWLHLGLKKNLLEESINEKVLTIYLQQGQFSRAREHLQTLQQAYQQQYSQELPRALQAFEAALASQNEEFTDTTSPWPVSHTAPVPFVGQSEALNVLQRLLQRGGALLLAGESGSGKTRLAQEAWQRYAPASRLLTASCQPLEGSQPFAPWISLLRSAVRPQEWRRLDSVWARPLMLLLPEIGKIRPGLAPVSGEKPIASRTTLLEALRQTLLLLAESGPLYVFLDDIHWADESTLEAIAYLLKHQFFTGKRASLLMASRLEMRNSLLDHLLLTTFPQPLARLEVRPLNEAEVAELSLRLLGNPLPGDFNQRLRRDMGGNPLFVLETLNALRQNVSLSPEAQEFSFTLPRSVQEILLNRVRALPAPAREMLTAAAILGSRFEIDLAEKVSGLTPEESVQALETLERARLVESFPGSPNLYTFSHEKIRETLQNSLSAARQRFLHRKSAEVLQGNLPQAQAARLAHHLEQAGEPLRAFDCWLDAAAYAYRLAAIGETNESFRRAEHLLSSASAISEEQIYHLYASWNKAAFENDNPDEMERINRTLLSLGRERVSPLLMGTALSCMADVGMARNQFETGLEYARQAYPFVQQSGSEYEMAQLLNRTGVMLYMQGKMRESQDWFAKTLTLTEGKFTSDLLWARASAYYQMAITEILCGYPLQGIENAKKCLSLHHEQEDLYGEVTAYSALSLGHYLCAEYAAGLESAREGIQRAERIDGWRMDGYLNGYASMNALELGLLGEAWEYAQKTISLGRKRGHSEIVGLGYKTLGDIYNALHSYSRAAELYRMGMMASGEHFVALENMHRYGFALYMQGQRNVGKDFLQHALEKSQQAGLGSIQLLAARLELRLLAEEGQVEAFKRRAAWFREEIQTRLKTEAGQLAASRLEATLHLREGREYEAIESLRRPLVLYRRIGNVWNELEALQIQAMALNHLGQDPSEQCLRMGQILHGLENSLSAAPLEEDLRSFWVKFLA